MPSINWDTVTTSAVTALLVTLAVEYAAKPRLEVRKERILAAHRTRREVPEMIAAIAISAGTFLAVSEPKGMKGDERDAFITERNRQYERLRIRVQDAADNIDRHGRTFTDRPMMLVMGFIGTAQGIMLSTRTRHDKARMVYDMSRQAATALDGRWWPARTRASWELQRLVEASQEPGDRGPNGLPGAARW
jgi:hypothetical protein